MCVRGAYLLGKLLLPRLFFLLDEINATSIGRAQGFHLLPRLGPQRSPDGVRLLARGSAQETAQSGGNHIQTRGECVHVKGTKRAKAPREAHTPARDTVVDASDARS